jgi:hypothetical protein
VTLQGSTPGTADVGNFNITGTGIAGVLKAASLDTASAGTLGIGNTNATTINIGTNAAAHSINIGTGAAAQTIIIGSTTTTSSLNLKTGSGGFSLNTSGTNTVTSDSAGRIVFAPVSNNATSIFKIQDAGGSSLFNVASGTNLISLGAPVQSSYYIQTSSYLNLTAGAIGTYSTPVGASVPTKINIVTYDPGGFGQVVAMGVPSSAASSARVIAIYDARTVAHQPSIALLSPDENQIFGFSWDGSNSIAAIKTTSTSLALQADSKNVAIASYDSANSISDLLLGASWNQTGRLTLANSTNANTVSLRSGVSSLSYVINLPTGMGGVGQCLAVSSVAGSTQSLGYASCGGGGSSGVSLQSTTPGTADVGNFNITGTGIAAILQAGTSVRTSLLDTISAGALNLGTTNATSIVLAQNTSVSAGKTLTVGDATNYVKFSSNFSTSGRLYGGTGRPTRQIKLIPEFVGSVFRADGTNNIGYMTSDFISGLSSTYGYKHNYYAWATDQTGTPQDYDINVLYQLPSDFDDSSTSSGFVSGSLKLWVQADSTTSTSVAYEIKDVDGTSCSSGTITFTDANWKQATLTTPSSGGGCTYAANDLLTITFKPSAISPQTNYVRIGEFQYDYNSKF